MKAPSTTQEDLRRLRLMVQKAPFCVHEINLDGTIRSINPEGCRLLGFAQADQIEGKPFVEVVAPHSLAAALDAFGRAVQGETLEFECELLGKERNFITNSHLFPMRNERGDVVSLFGMAFDTTQGHEAMEELRRNEQRYRQMFETNLAVKFILDPDSGRILEVNKAACRFYGYSRAEMEGMSIFDINVLTAEEIRTKMVLAAKENRLRFEFTHRLKNGKKREVEVFSGPVNTAEGVCIYSIIQDITERKLAERALKKSRERFELVIQGSNDGIWDIDFVRGTVFWSDRCKSLLGYAPQEVDANVVDRRSFFHPEDLGSVRQAMSCHLKHHHPYDLETRLRHKDGHFVWFNIRGQAVWDAEGTPLRMAGSIRDIHERHKITQQLQISEQRFSFAVEASQDGVWEWDIVKNLYWWSSRLKRLLGYENQEIHASRDKLYELMHPDDVAITLEKADRVLSSGKRFQVRYRLRTKSKGYRWFLVRGQAALDASGKPIRASGVLSDIHETTLADYLQEARLGRLEKQHQCILSLAADSSLADRSLRESFQRITENAVQVLGIGRCSVQLVDSVANTLRSADLYVGDRQEHFDGFVHEGKEYPKFFAMLECNRALVSRNPQLDSRYEEFPRSFFRERKIRSQIQVPLRRWGKVVGVISVSDTQQERNWQEDEVDFVLDLANQTVRFLEHADARTARQKQDEIERQMMQAQKAESLGLMAGGVAHDFNNLLVAILGNADLLRELVPPESRQQALVSEVITASQRAAELCQQMLAFSGHHTLRHTTFNLCDLVREMSHILSISIGENTQLEIDCKEELPQMDGDATQLRQVIMNLILNASESITDEGGHIFVRTELRHVVPSPIFYGLSVPEAGDYLSLAVKDNGLGMNASTLHKLFDPFFTTKFAGRGLGLAAVMGIVRAHRGGIEVRSQLGRGSLFQVFFPVSKLPAVPSPISAGVKDAWSGSGEVLLIDDDEVVIQLAQTMLERLGFSVRIAADGEQALAIFREHHQNLVLVLLDLTMPGLNGEAVFQALQDMEDSVPVLMSSGYTEQDVAQKLGKLGKRGKIHFLQKPYTLDQLRGTIQAVFSA